MSFFTEDDSSSSSNIRPDEPEWKSVMMGSLAPPAPLSFGAVPRMPKATTLARVSPKAPQVVLKESSNPTQSWRPEPLQPIPDAYPIERSHVLVDAGRQRVADRITSHLKKSSVAATFSDQTATAEAETSDNIRFCINLFAGENDEITVVEVQRLCGCGFSFRESCRALLGAAKGAKAAPRPRRVARPIPASIRAQPQQESDVQEAVELNIDMLLNISHLDMHLLAMEALNQLTNDSSTSLLAAKCIVQPNSALLVKIVSLIEEASEEAKDSDELDNYNVKMRRYALSILGNALEAMLKDNQTAVPLLMATDSLLKSLVNELAFAQERPHDACRAAKCLSCFSKVVPDKLFGEAELAEALAIAHKEGCCRHANLEEETQKLLQRQVGSS